VLAQVHPAPDETQSVPVIVDEQDDDASKNRRTMEQKKHVLVSVGHTDDVPYKSVH